MVMKNFNYDQLGSRTTTWITGPTPLPASTTSSNIPYIKYRRTNVYSENGDKIYKTSPNHHSYDLVHVAHWRGKRTSFYPVPGMPEHRYETRGVFGSNSADGYAPPWERQSLYSRALEKLNAKTRGGLDLSISLAEAGQTKRMIKSTGKFLDFAKYAGLGGFVAGTRAAANGWLQFQYGWKPLLSDVFAAADEGIRIVINQLEHFHARAKTPMKDTLSPLQVVDGKLVPTEVVMTGVQSAQFNLALRMPASTFDASRWSSLNPISIGWELIPYSFVFDWFVDVGSYLRNVETALLYSTRFHSGSLSELYSVSTEEFVPFFLYKDPGGINQKWEEFSLYSHKVNFLRTKLISYPLPRPPTFQADLGSGRMITAASLLRQLLKK
jgi:hypothetical protein